MNAVTQLPHTNQGGESNLCGIGHKSAISRIVSALQCAMEAVAKGILSFRVGRLLSNLKVEFDLVKDDKKKSELIRDAVFEIVGRPGGLSPPTDEDFQSDNPRLPSKPPKLYLKDRLDDETPPQFIQRIYGKWLGKGLTRSFFRQEGQDKSLYNALANWLAQPGNTLPPEFGLLNQKQLLDHKIRQYRENGSADGLSARDYLSVRSAAARRRQPAPTS